MKPLLATCIAVMVLFTLSNGLAQNEKASVTVSIAALNPVGGFSERIGDDAKTTRRSGFQIGKNAGLAATGAGIGIEFNQPISNNRISWLLSGRLLINPTDVTEISEFFQDELGDSIAVSFENGAWINIPLFTGFAYKIPLTSSWALESSVQAGVNITRQASRKAIVAGRTVEKTRFFFTPDFGVEAGLAVEWRQKIRLGVQYLNLASPRYEGIRKLDAGYYTTIPKLEMNVDGDERPVSMLVFSWGYRL
mgnify:CR=1 FL=1